MGIFLLGNVPSILGDNLLERFHHIRCKKHFDAFDFVQGNILFMLTAPGCAISLVSC